MGGEGKAMSETATPGLKVRVQIGWVERASGRCSDLVFCGGKHAIQFSGGLYAVTYGTRIEEEVQYVSLQPSRSAVWWCHRCAMCNRRVWRGDAWRSESGVGSAELRRRGGFRCPGLDGRAGCLRPGKLKATLMGIFGGGEQQRAEARIELGLLRDANTIMDMQPRVGRKSCLCSARSMRT